jgi:hypothetical protein
MKFIKRQISPHILRSAKNYKIISIIGPRQSGKTFLSKYLFKCYKYQNLEDPSIRSFAKEDPEAFLSQAPRLIIDEIQRVPKLLSYLQILVDENKSSKFVITGSQNLLISEKISQTLAGRVAIFKLLPFSFQELKQAKIDKKNLLDQMLTGFYPRLYTQNLSVFEWYMNYIETYVERDVRQVKAINNLDLFQKFLRLLAGRCGQILNKAALSNDLGISEKTVSEWFSVLSTSFITFKLTPYYKQFNKRLIKSPKLFFYDTGLVFALLNIKNRDQLKNHPLAGNIFENFVIAEYLKNDFNQRFYFNYYFFRDKTGNEIDLIVDTGQKTKLIEIKMAQTFSNNFSKGFDYFKKISNLKTENLIIYGGKENQTRSNFNLKSWREL